MDWTTCGFHPAFVLRGNQRYSGLVVKVAMARWKALGNANGWRPKWDRSNYIIKPSLSTALTVLKKMTTPKNEVSFDIETNGEHPLSPKHQVRCIAFHDGKSTICIPFLYRTGEKESVVAEGKKKPTSRAVWAPYWGKDERKKVNAAVQHLFNVCALDTQNGQYDRLCLEANEGFEVPVGTASFDTILAHHIVASYFPHNLGFIAANYTEAPYYKTTDDGEAWSAASDDALWTYCADDVCVTWQAAQKLRAEVQERALDIALYAHDAWQEQECQRWRHVGMHADLQAIELLKKHYISVRDKALASMRVALAQCAGAAPVRASELNELMDLLLVKAENDASDDAPVELDALGRSVEKFNPGSLKQLRLLLRHLGVPLTNETTTGELSTAKEFLLEARKELLLGGMKSDAPALAFLDFLFAWREAAKIEGTYLYPELIPEEQGRVWQESVAERGALQNTYGVHASFNVHVVPTGRLASSKVNMQNQPENVRCMYVARPNHVLVTGDWDALEMRLAAILSGDEKLLKVFNEYDAGGLKPHIVNAAAIFGLKADKSLPEKFPECYRAAKVFAYAVAYGAGPTTVYDQCRKEMSDLNFDDFLKLYEAYKRLYPKLFEFQRDVTVRGTQRGYLDSPILKRRVFFFERVLGQDSPEASRMQNFSYQSGGADIVSLANRRIMDRVVLPWRSSRLRPGEHLEQLAQVHDELLFEVPIRLADEFAKLYKAIAEEVPVQAPETFKRLALPVAVKVQKPVREGAPSRWKPVHYPCAKCGADTVVEMMDARKSTVDNVIWLGQCGADKCRGRGKEFSLALPRRAAC